MPYACKHAQSCPTLCDPTDYSLPDSFVHGILQAGIGCHFLLQGLPDPGIELASPALQMDSLLLSQQGSPLNAIQ